MCGDNELLVGATECSAFGDISYRRFFPVFSFLPIRVHKPHRIIIRIPIPIEVAPVRWVYIHRVRGQEAQGYGVVVALLHVGQVGVGVGDVAGVAGAFAVQAGIRGTVGHADGALGLDAVGVGFDVGAAQVIGVVVGGGDRVGGQGPAALGDEFAAQVDVVDALVVAAVFDIQQLAGAAVDLDAIAAIAAIAAGAVAVGIVGVGLPGGLQGR